MRDPSLMLANRAESTRDSLLSASPMRINSRSTEERIKRLALIVLKGETSHGHGDSISGLNDLVGEGLGVTLHKSVVCWPEYQPKHRDCRWHPPSPSPPVGPGCWQVLFQVEIGIHQDRGLQGLELHKQVQITTAWLEIIPYGQTNRCIRATWCCWQARAMAFNWLARRVKLISPDPGSQPRQTADSLVVCPAAFLAFHWLLQPSSCCCVIPAPPQRSTRHSAPAGGPTHPFPARHRASDNARATFFAAHDTIGTQLTSKGTDLVSLQKK